MDDTTTETRTKKTVEERAALLEKQLRSLASAAFGQGKTYLATNALEAAEALARN